MTAPILCLLIDDDPDDQEIFQVALEEMDIDINCTTSGSGSEALRLISEPGFSTAFIFLDLNMPKMSGRECLAELKKIEKLKAIPIYIYSTSSSETDRADTMGMGATGFITKPNTVEELQSLLNSIFICDQQPNYN